MLHVLIDTSSFKQMVSRHEQNYQLQYLLKWAKEGSIAILIPEALAKEWQKHRAEEIKKVKRSVQDSQKILILHQVHFDENNVRSAEQVLEAQVYSIDQIFQSGVKVLTSETVFALGYKKRQSRRPPYHKKLESDSDFELLYSTLSHITEKKESQLLFLSANTKDFAVPKDDDFVIHPEISSDFKSIDIVYFSKPDKFFKHLSEALGVPVRKPQVNLIKHKSIPLPIERTLPIIDQLTQYFELRFKGIEYYPIDLMKDDYPFKVDDDISLFYRQFSLSTDNAAILSLVSESKIDHNSFELPEFHKKDVIDADSKFEQILHKLNGQWIFYIRNAKFSGGNLVRFFDNKPCDCIRCQLMEFRLTSFVSQLYSSTRVKEKALKEAYVLYSIGDFKGAFELLADFVEDPENSSRYNELAIGWYNLTKLNRIMFAQLSSLGRQQLVESLDSIDLKTRLNQFKKPENSTFIDYLIEGKFYTDSIIRIGNLNNEVRKNYNLQMKGGMTSNSTHLDLISEYLKVDTFLNENFIIFDSFQEFSNVFHLFFEAIIVCHAIPSNRGTKLEKVDDLVLRRMIYYGDPEELQGFINTYNIKVITPNLKLEDTSSSFLMYCLNLLSSYADCLNFSKQHDKDKHAVFWRKYNGWLASLLTLWTYIDLPQQNFEKFSSLLGAILKNPDEIYARTRNIAIGFYSRPDLKYSQNAKDEIFDLFIGQIKFHQPEPFLVFSDLLKRGSNYQLNDEQFHSLVDLHFDNVPQPHGIPTAKTIVFFWEIFTESQKAFVKDKITTRLESEHFDAELYYNAIMHGILDDSAPIDKLWNAFMPKPGAQSLQSVLFGKNEERFESVNALLNIAIHLKLNLSDDKFNAIRVIDPYYAWLLDLDGFDYSKFDPYWITEYKTIPFIRHFRKSERLKNYLISFLKADDNPTIMKFFFDVYNQSH